MRRLIFTKLPDFPNDSQPRLNVVDRDGGTVSVDNPTCKPFFQKKTEAQRFNRTTLDPIAIA